MFGFNLKEMLLQIY